MQITLELACNTTSNVDELCVPIYSAGRDRVAILDLRQPDAAYMLRRSSASCQIELSRVMLVEGDYAPGLYCRTLDSRGHHYDLGGFTVTLDSSRSRVVPYADQYRGIIELDYSFAFEQVELPGH